MESVVVAPVSDPVSPLSSRRSAAVLQEDSRLRTSYYVEVRVLKPSSSRFASDQTSDRFRAQFDHGPSCCDCLVEHHDSPRPLQTHASCKAPSDTALSLQVNDEQRRSRDVLTPAVPLEGLHPPTRAPTTAHQGLHGGCHLLQLRRSDTVLLGTALGRQSIAVGGWVRRRGDCLYARVVGCLGGDGGKATARAEPSVGKYVGQGGVGSEHWYVILSVWVIIVGVVAHRSSVHQLPLRTSTRTTS